MPSTKKRITVYVTDEQHALVQRVAVASGDSMGATVAGLIDAAAPMLGRVAELAEAIRAAPDDVRATFAGAADQLEQQYGGLLEDADRFWGDLHGIVTAEGPRLVTRGPES